MLNILENQDLSAYNTFGISVRAKFLAVVENLADLKELSSRPEFQNNQRMFLGGGSNVLFLQDFAGLIVINKIKGMRVVQEDADFMYVYSASGEIWNDLVNFAVEHSVWGIENLAFIPGTVGGAPMQNIGAYGDELKNSLESVEVLDLSTMETKVLANTECKFGYRDSIFKNEAKGKYFILGITLKLSKHEKKNIKYKVLADYIAKNNLTIDTPADVSKAVTEIRKSKLPDPAVLGNAGSFFKNVFVSPLRLEELQKDYKDMPFFKENGEVKIPAGWLIEQCGFKGKRLGKVGVYDKQSLVLVSYGGAKGEEVFGLAKEIIKAVQDKFGLVIAPEVNIC